MKLINYNYGYLFDCSIHGKITMTYREWTEAMKYLYSVLKKEEDYFKLDIFIDDVNRRIPIKGGFLINVRVSLTYMLVKKYGLKRYKPNNYMLEVR